jgi:hypothetical protein
MWWAPGECRMWAESDTRNTCMPPNRMSCSDMPHTSVGWGAWCATATKVRHKTSRRPQSNMGRNDSGTCDTVTFQQHSKTPERVIITQFCRVLMMAWSRAQVLWMRLTLSNDPTEWVSSQSFNLRTEKDPVREMLCSFSILDIEQVIPNATEPYGTDLYSWHRPGINHSFRKLQRTNIQLAKCLTHVTFLMRCKSQDIIPSSSNWNKLPLLDPTESVLTYVMT